MIIHLPFFPLLALAALTGAAALQLRRRRRQNGQADAQEPDWSAPVLDEAADRDSPFHRWDARLKIASLFIYCFLVVSLQTLTWAAAALAISIAAVMASRIPWSRPLRRLAAMSGFLTMFLIVVPLTAPAVPGETLIVLDPFSPSSSTAKGYGSQHWSWSRPAPSPCSWSRSLPPRPWP